MPSQWRTKSTNHACWSRNIFTDPSMLDESAGRNILGADSFLSPSGLTCLASHPPRMVGLYFGGLAVVHLCRASSSAASKYFSNPLVATARCSRHCAMLHWSVDGFQLS